LSRRIDDPACRTTIKVARDRLPGTAKGDVIRDVRNPRCHNSPSVAPLGNLPARPGVGVGCLAMSRNKSDKAYVVRSSAIHGRGVFAKAKIRKGTLILEYKGKRTTWEEAMEQPDSDPDDPAHTFLFELDDGRVIDARFRGNAARWINHSCAPNCVTSEDEDGHVFIEAKHRIRPGEELTYDYRLSVGGRLTKEERKQYACRCGAARCRGSLLYRK
jgi:SET domain-containing protein